VLDQLKGYACIGVLQVCNVCSVHVLKLYADAAKIQYIQYIVIAVRWCTLAVRLLEFKVGDP
jgi:hypothetical protein